MNGSSELLTFNGINGITGHYNVPQLPAEAIARAARGEKTDKQHLAELKRRQTRTSEAHFAVSEGVDPKKLSETGWGVIFAFGADPAIYEALAPLLQLREQQASASRQGLYREFSGMDAYLPGESKLAFLSRHGAGPGPVDPDVIPYYLLIVGDPETIPLRFQYQLDVQYAVGRIHFGSIDEYAAYACSVVEAETGTLALPRRAAFFGVANEGDATTRLSHDELMLPIVKWVAQNQPTWKTDSYLGVAATKTRLATLMGAEAPAFLFTASHGMCYPNGDSRQFAHQGALLCQDWPGPECRGEVSRDQFFSGEDMSSDARVFGMIAMHFACFSAGTPMLTNFSLTGEPERLADRGFLGQLPQRLLAHPRGGALAVIGHVERAWGCSFHWSGADSQTEVFKSTMKRLMEGHPVGSALEYFNGRYAELSSDLSTYLEEARFGATIDPYHLSGLWAANNDARSFSVIGDPAVRLRLAEGSVPSERPAIQAGLLVVSAPEEKKDEAVSLNFDVASYEPGDSFRETATSLEKTVRQLVSALAAAAERLTTENYPTPEQIELAKVTASVSASLKDALRTINAWADRQ